MTISEHIKNSTKQFKPTSQKINLYDPNVRNTCTRFFKIKDEKGNGFKLYDFSDRIMLETKVKTSLLFAINQPENICLANELLERNIYTNHSNDNSVLSCVDLIQQDIQEIQLQKNEALFVYRNVIKLLVDKARQLIPEIEFLQKIKLVIEDKFPDSVEIIDTSKIPKDLRDLVPYFEEWAISDDLERDEKIKKSSKSKLQKVVDIVNSKIKFVNNYLDSFGDEALPYEATLIMNLAELVAELTLPKR
ncbi:hypothetical protein [Pinibacter soli]|uniref:Uncharacterized protein n=1 Tax=Pinibacter soli TaxID=3044211 RepID=A0ABT6RFF2_9BACT|nr:hypothetical protein [Pinibacter soli]MDI3321307.1 hypothetical protein [Pinibacter soli]